MPAHTQETCLRCATCCLAHMIAYVTDDDLARWHAEQRADILSILEHSAPVWAGDRLVASSDGRHLSFCPFLMHDGRRGHCTIYETRPKACRHYEPGSSEICPLHHRRHGLSPSHLYGCKGRGTPLESAGHPVTSPGMPEAGIPMHTTDIRHMTPSELVCFLAGLGKETYRAGQITRWMYQRGVRTFDGMTNLSKHFREELASVAHIGVLRIDRILESKDGTKKILFILEDGLAVESVLIRERNHWTLCVSTQAGCGMGCAFCLTGAFGFKRNLLPGEIVDQIAMLKFSIPEGSDILNIVMMGMGEPLANYENTLKAVAIITGDTCLGFSKRRITVSTCGIVPMIGRLSKDTEVNLAVSLNAADNTTRSMLVPVNRTYPLEMLIDACRDYRMPRRRRITFEYVLIDGVNDSEYDARKLSALVAGVNCKFNLIPFNEFQDSSFKTPPGERVQSFRRVLVSHHFTAVVRMSKGGDIMAACGQLSGQLEDHTAKTIT
ncbi:MAG: 23S rRNA (adenine(2503)-C(2))-methyltransferase RlmN [Deltaproteobacteria bacterium]|nr:23S rRNA (adenine(2503)-C(2))-methyltransferase RlmN [Deltaproteobacteria bacterium]